MASYNRVILIGNLCRDPDLKKTEAGLSVTEMRIAVNEVFKSRLTGERNERTCYVDVIAWNQQADLCSQYLHKGSALFVEGRLQYDEWRTPQGETRNRLRVMADRVQFLTPPPGSRAAVAIAQQQQQHQQMQAAAGIAPLATGPVPTDPNAVAPLPPPVADPLPYDPTNEEPPF